MRTLNFIFAVFLMLAVYSCNKGPKANDDLRQAISGKEFALQGDSLQQFNSILDKLDQHNEPLKKFVYHTFYEIQDSMDVVMPHTDTLSEKGREAYSLKKADLTVAAIKKYQKKLDISSKEEEIIQYAFVLDPNVKSFCRQYIVEASNGKISF